MSLIQDLLHMPKTHNPCGGVISAVRNPAGDAWWLTCSKCGVFGISDFNQESDSPEDAVNCFLGIPKYFDEDTGWIIGTFCLAARETAPYMKPLVRIATPASP